MRPAVSLFIALSISAGSSLGAADSTTGGATSAKTSNPQPAKATPANQVSSAPAAAEDSYPHVTQLETYILGQTHMADSLPARLARMEAKAFGAPSKNDDLSARTDALTQYADDKLGKKTPVATDEMYETVEVPADYNQSGQAANESSASDGAGQSKYPHITSLEKEILGQAYEQDALPARLTRMEEKAFGAPSSDPDLTNRTDALESYAEKVLHKKSFAKEQAEIADSQGCAPSSEAAAAGAAPTSKSKALLNFVGNQILGMGLPGFGVGGLGNFGGVRVRPRSAVQQQQQQGALEADAHPPEDPLVQAPTPPPAGTRMITQVGWCEMRVFGHTSPTLHLVARLDQLNKELNFAPDQNGFDLMDDVPKLIKIVEARTPAPPAPKTAATPPAVAH